MKSRVSNVYWLGDPSRWHILVQEESGRAAAALPQRSGRLNRQTWLSDEKDIGQAISSAGRNASWVVCQPEFAEKLAREICSSVSVPLITGTRATGAASRRRRPRELGRLLLLTAPRPETLPMLKGRFARVVGEVSNYRFLDVPDLAEIFSASTPRDFFIGSAVDTNARGITLVRGDFSQTTLPFDFFTNFPSVERPTFDDVEVIDCGQTLRLGRHEASTESILYEIDPDFRHRSNASRRDNNSSFGACLRRLRKQRGLRQSDFEPEISARTISRIEQGLDHAPRDKSLRLIEKKLGVPPESIPTF